MSKRRADNDIKTEADSKRREFEDRVTKYTCRLLIPTKFGGQLIGKGGSIAKEMRARHSVDMFIPDSRGPERLVRIKTDERDDLANCVREVGEKLQEDMNRVLNLKDEETEVRVLFHKSLCGTIIGRGGSDIKNLREATKCAIRLNGECCPDSTDRVCQIAGLPDDILDAFDQIMNLLENVEIKGDDKWYNVENYDERVSRDYGGFTVGQIEPGKSGSTTGRGRGRDGRRSNGRDDRRGDRDERRGDRDDRRHDDRREDRYDPNHRSDRQPANYYRNSDNNRDNSHQSNNRNEAPVWQQPPPNPQYNYYQPPPGTYYQPPPGAYHPPPAHHSPHHAYAPPPAPQYHAGHPQPGAYYQAPPPPQGDYYRSSPQNQGRGGDDRGMKRESGDYYRDGNRGGDNRSRR